MDFSSRNSQPSAGAAHTGASFSPDAPKSSSKRSDDKSVNKWFKRSFGLFFVVVALLLITLVAFLMTANSQKESDLVDSSKLQAVFLQNDQVYFGNITALNNKYLTLENIYYLQTSSTGKNNTASNVSLVKLGCELHRPYDKMVINRSEVTFWENLQEGGQVAKAVAQFQKENPNGQKCSDTTNNSANTGDVQGNGSASTNTSGNSDSNSNNNSNSSNNSTNP